jgi:hypothetical protein
MLAPLMKPDISLGEALITYEKYPHVVPLDQRVGHVR